MTWHKKGTGTQAKKTAMPKVTTPKVVTPKPPPAPKPAPAQKPVAQTKPLTKGGKTGVYDAKRVKMGHFQRGKI